MEGILLVVRELTDLKRLEMTFTPCLDESRATAPIGLHVAENAVEPLSRYRHNWSKVNEQD